MALSPQQWETVRAYFERGLSLADIVGRDDVLIKSRGSISKRAKIEGWIAGGKKQQVTREVLANQELEAVRSQKETLGAQERNIHDALVSETLRFQTFFRGANMLVAKQVKGEGASATSKGLASAAVALGRTQEKVLGKSPDSYSARPLSTLMVTASHLLDRSMGWNSSGGTGMPRLKVHPIATQKVQRAAAHAYAYAYAYLNVASEVAGGRLLSRLRSQKSPLDGGLHGGANLGQVAFQTRPVA